eukprot:jgi/Tetstr1/464232/TSEL_009037.t1
MPDKSSGGGTKKRSRAARADAEDRVATARIMTESMKSAVSRPPSAPLDSETILRIVSEIQSGPGDVRAKAERYSRKYPAFMEQCPVLFQKACRPGLDMNMLRFMVDTMRANEEEESSSIVGARLAERFVTPSVDPPPRDG